MNADLTPPPAPAHQCINAACGCNDQVSAGSCSEWCAANGIEASALERGHAEITPCGCGHATCAANMPAKTGGLAGTPERGPS